MVDPNFTVYIRLPIPRGDFVDPPPVDWNSSKDDELWSIVSGAAKTEIDSLHFDVTVPFLLQQVAYLTERHTSQLRAQVRKATAAAKGSAAPSPVPMPEHPTQHARANSALSLRRDSRADGSGAGTPVPSSFRPNIVSRNTSINTAAHASVNSGSGTGANITSPRTKAPPQKQQQQQQQQQQKKLHRLSSLPVETPQSPDLASPPRDDSSSFDSSDDSESLPAQSRIIRRPPRFQPAHRNEGGPRDLDDDGDETDAEPAFAAQPATGTSNSSVQDLASTIRGDGATPRRPDRGKGKGKEKATHHPETSDSSTTSSPALPSRGAPGGGSQRRAQGQGPLSPRRAAELAGGLRSPARREGSDGTPSMGSSFSDLDDASVTQSALEEAIASKMQDGAMGSRFSITQAFRSRYTPKGR
ncbi:hypothetical protein ACRALDRAFT_2040055 [Sodiomyces alcalophilus JCM 7366]|uniref:uncharacterized protein n=1 Tax=Sodiomyces alcalophilus JCM 7366 TaxID=591952 RepID=UPI0039B4F44E